MSRSDGNSRGNTSGSTRRFAVDRRSYLKLAGVAAGSAALFSGPASASFSRRGISFDRTVDMVADAGCDPTGREPCDEQIREAADDYTLLRFPAGEYKITEKNAILGKTNLGFLGEGDVRFVVPEEFNEKVLVVDRGTGLLFEGIDIDQTAYGATPALHLGVDDDLQVHDVSLIGQGIHPDSIPKGQPGYSPGPGPENGNPAVHDFFYPIVHSADGTGVVTDLDANNHGLMGTYNAGNGRSGIWVGIANYGTITFKDCHIEEFGSNGTYTSRTYGVVQYEGGVYRNNDNNQIRLGSEGSYIDGASLEVDADASEAPNPDEALNYRGVRIEMGHNYVPVDVTVRNCDISIRSTPHSGGGIVAEATAGEFSVENTRIGIDPDGVRGVLGKEPDGGGAYAPPAKPHSGTLANVSITGDAAGTEAIKLINRPDSVVKNCCIQTPGANRDGVVVVDSDGCRVKNSTIDVTGVPVVEERSSVLAYGNAERGTCPVPELGGSGSDLPHTLSLESGDGDLSYAFSVTGDLEKSTANGASIDPEDTITASTARGTGGDGGIDSYAFSGDLVSFDLDGEANVTLDGESAHVGGLPDHVLTIEGMGPTTTYTFNTSGDLERSAANGASIDDDDHVSGSSAFGTAASDTDSYVFSGELESFDLDGEANVTLDGESAHVGGRPDHVLTIEGIGPRADYTFSVSGDLEKSTANGATLNDGDDITDTTASGAVLNGNDSYTFSGSLVSFALDGEANVTLDGEPAHVGERPDHVLTVGGTGSRADYTFSVTKGLEKSTANGATLNDGDDITDTTASGAVLGGNDSYVFSGSLESFDLDGEAYITLDGEPAHVGRRF